MFQFSFLTLYKGAKRVESKCNDQAAGLWPSIAKAITEACTAPVKHIKVVKDSCAGYTFIVIAWTIEGNKK